MIDTEAMFTIAITVAGVTAAVAILRHHMAAAGRSPIALDVRSIPLGAATAAVLTPLFAIANLAS